RSYQVRSDLDRSGRILVDTTETYVGEAIQFEISLTKSVNEDLEKIWVRWDFDSDGEWDTPFSYQKTKNHVYSLAGTYVPSAEVRFGNSADTAESLLIKGLSPSGLFRRILPTKHWDKIQVLPARILAPSVQVSPGKMGNTESTTFTFDASQNHLPGGGWIEWSFDGEPFAKKYIGQEVVRKTFLAPGTHEVRTRSCIQRSAPICEETLTTVEVKRDPTDFQLEINGQNLTNPTSFSLGNSQVNIFTGDTIRLSALKRQSSSDSAKFEYRWRVDPISSESTDSRPWGTGFSTQTFTEMSFHHTGMYLLTAEARNEHGISARVSRKINVSPQPPIKIDIDVKTEEIFPGEWVHFLPNIQVQNNGGPQVYTSSFLSRFDVDGDGIWDADFRSGGGQQWRFDQPGTYAVKMQVMDAWKKVRTVQKNIVVKAYPAPVARVKISHQYGTTDTQFEFDAQPSEGRSLSFLWKIDESDFQKRNSRFFQRFSTPGTKWITLRVVDKDMKYNDVHFSVEVKKGSLATTNTQTQNDTQIQTSNVLKGFAAFTNKKSQTPNYSGESIWGLPERMH
ncbi:hypothetical protein HC823_00260, partial [Candidatus Gracilibacteria bacterium]|nr:hypothetical protein [Candidatus Gracilibacteria bacterium]